MSLTQDVTNAYITRIKTAFESKPSLISQDAIKRFGAFEHKRSVILVESGENRLPGNTYDVIRQVDVTITVMTYADDDRDGAVFAEICGVVEDSILYTPIDLANLGNYRQSRPAQIVESERLASVTGDEWSEKRYLLSIPFHNTAYHS